LLPSAAKWRHESGMGGLSDNFRGAALMVVAMAGFVLNDTLVKLLAGQLSLFQVIAVRGLVATALLGLLAWHQKALFPALEKAEWRLLGLRIIGEVGSTLCYLTALFHMPLANATAILQSLPLAVTLGAAVFLREHVGWRRYLAIAIGFAGVLIIVRPGSEGFNTFSLSAVAAMGFMVLRDLTTRSLARHVPSIFVAFITAVAITLAGLVLSPLMEWHPIGAPEFTVVAGAALFLVFAYLFNVMAMRVGEIGFVSPFRYTILIWAIVLGMVVFGDIPDQWTLAGSTVVVVMGIYTFYRERRLHRAAVLARVKA
jgi:drug/metabolite transporter (DMT)-like permease